MSLMLRSKLEIRFQVSKIQLTPRYFLLLIAVYRCKYIMVFMYIKFSNVYRQDEN
jgi:hypothetical protein